MVTSALVSDGRLLAQGLGEQAVFRAAGDAALLVSGVPAPFLNGIITARASVDLADVNHLLDAAELKSIPHCVQIRPGCDPQILELLRRRGFTEDEATPLMVMQPAASDLAARAIHPELAIRVIDPDEAGLHAAVGAAGFDAPLELFEKFVTPNVLKQPGYRAYLGTVAGEPVTTALGVTAGEHVGVFDVATPAQHRGRGYGAAITARAALDGFDAGASFAYLQSSAAGYGIYQRLGFRTMETWTVWLSPGSQSHS